MRPTGMLRKVDELGRIVLPAEVRQDLNINVKDYIEIYTDNGSIVLKKHRTSCTFCTNEEDLIPFGKKQICPGCLAKIKALN